MSIPEFTSMEDELSYWKEQASLFKSKYEQEVEASQESLITSQEIEKELESQLQLAESERDQYKSKYEQANFQQENFQAKFIESTKSLNNRINYLENELSLVTADVDNARKQIRSLEQQNDDLERSNRATAFSLEDFETKLNTALERNALLENELDEKENLQVTIQRLREEARDLKAELNARQKANSQMQQEWNRTNESFAEDSKKKRLSTRMESDDRVSQSCEDALSETIPHNSVIMRKDYLNGRLGDVVSSTAAILPQQDDLPPTVRNSALNLISDLLRKINVLELKLSTLYNTYGSNRDSTVAAPSLNLVRSPSLNNGI